MTSAGLVVGALLATAVLVRDGAFTARPGFRRERRVRAAKAPPDAELLAGARLAERVAALLGAGVLPQSAWEHAGAGREPVPPAVAAVRQLVESTGAPAVQALEACAAGLRAEAGARAAVRVAVAGAAVSARTVSLLPVAGLALGALLGAPPWESLLGSPFGRLCLVVGLVLLVAGRWWSRRLVRAARRAGS